MVGKCCVQLGSTQSVTTATAKLKESSQYFPTRTETSTRSPDPQNVGATLFVWANNVGMRVGKSQWRSSAQKRRRQCRDNDHLTCKNLFGPERQCPAIEDLKHSLPVHSPEKLTSSLGPSSRLVIPKSTGFVQDGKGKRITNIRLDGAEC
jgi:hypothetical protein